MRSVSLGSASTKSSSAPASNNPVMSQWKSAGDNWSTGGSRSVRRPAVSQDEASRSSSIVKSILGFCVLIGINAFAAFCATRLIGIEISYFRCVLLAVVWVVFRTYDKLWIDSLREAIKK